MYVNVPLVDVFDKDGNAISGRRLSLRDGKEAAMRDTLIDAMRKSGLDVIADEANVQDFLSSLFKAAKTIKVWLTNVMRGESFSIRLPRATQRMICKVMGE